MNSPWTWWSALGCWLGSTLLLSRARWFRRPALVTRLAPYVLTVRPARPAAGRTAPGSRRGPGDLDAEHPVVAVLGPLVGAAGERIGSLLGTGDDLALRLQRSGLELEPGELRLRQCAWAAAAALTAAVAASVLGLPVAVAAAAIGAAPVLAVLVVEQRVTTAAVAWQRRVELELPVVVEQLGILLSSGSSLGSAIARVGRRGRGACAAELDLVARRLRQGVGEVEALREWARRAGVPAVDRLVGVLALNWEAGDLGTLIAAEARSVRREVQRAQIELLQRRAQQVWIPVTVATLLPGVIFMAVPFVAALDRLTGG